MKDTGVAEVFELINNNRVAAVANVADGKPWVRTLTTARVTEGLELYFATYEWSNKVKQLEADPNVCVTYLDFKGRDTRIFGRVEFLRDQPTKDWLWQESWVQYFAGEKDDPAYIIMKITPEKVEFRDHDREGLEYRRVM
jgi:general stress protein 26